jgi:hypothetical protein
MLSNRIRKTSKHIICVDNPERKKPFGRHKRPVQSSITFKGMVNINHLKTKRRLLYLNTQVVPRCKHFYLGYKNQSVYAVSGTSRCLFPDKYKTHKCSVGRAYSC